MSAHKEHAFDDGRNNNAGKGNGRTPPSRALFWPDLAELPTPDYIVKGLIDRGELVEIYGPIQSGKSFLGCDLALHIAARWDWHGRRVKGGGVLYVASEGGLYIKRRLAAFAQYYKLDLASIPLAVVLAPTNLLTPEGVEQLIADSSVVPDLCATFVDTVSRASPGNKEDFEDMGVLVDHCALYRNRTGSALIGVHHAGKDIARGSRGPNLLPASFDTVVATAKDKETETFNAKIEKRRDGTTGPLIDFQLHIETLGHDSDGDPITSCVVEKTGSETTTSPKKDRSQLTNRQRIALDTLEQAISFEGKLTQNSAHIPTNRPTVPFDTWRRFYLAATNNDDQSEDTRRRGLIQCRESLQARHHIGTWNEVAWII